MHQAPLFRPLDVRLAVSDMLRSTPTTLSVWTVCEGPLVTCASCALVHLYYLTLTVL